MFRLSLRLLLPVAVMICLIAGCSKRYAGGYSAGPAASASSNAISSSNDTAPRSGATSGDQQAAKQPAPPPFVRPPLQVRRGRYFTYAIPADWQASETANGVDMNSPDGRLLANAAMLVGNPGTTTPWSFTSNILSAAGCTNINGLSKKELGSLPSGYPGIYWQVQEFDLTFIDQSGVARHGDVTAAICNVAGGFSALFQGYSAPASDFDQAKTWLPLIASSVNAIDPSKVAYQNQLIPVRNHPLDNSGLMESWQARRLSQDRIAKAQQEGMLGYERTVSPTTGRYYNMPLETYDGAYGGYHNPDHPDEILNRTQPGE